jgi:hypothetical protein
LPALEITKSETPATMSKLNDMSTHVIERQPLSPETADAIADKLGRLHAVSHETVNANKGMFVAEQRALPTTLAPSGDPLTDKFRRLHAVSHEAIKTRTEAQGELSELAEIIRHTSGIDQDVPFHMAAAETTGDGYSDADHARFIRNFAKSMLQATQSVPAHATIDTVAAEVTAPANTEKTEAPVVDANSTFTALRNEFEAVLGSANPTTVEETTPSVAPASKSSFACETDALCAKLDRDLAALDMVTPTSGQRTASARDFFKQYKL